ncbi:MAG: N-acetyltransferase [Roseobacter sp.]
MHPHPVAAAQDYFGTDVQQTLLMRGRALYDLTRETTHFTYYGRAVGVFNHDDAPLEHVIALARLQGNSNYACVPNDRMAVLQAETVDHGLQPMHYARWVGADETLNMARKIVATRALPEDIRLEWLSAETPQETRASFADAALSCGVLPPNLAVLSGTLRPGACLMALDATGEVQSCAAAASFAHDAHPMGRTECWWGMLATRETARGHGLSLRLGAEVILEMNRRYGFTQVFTGVEPGNAPSEAVCARLGLRDTDASILGMADPGLIPGGRMTK